MSQGSSGSEARVDPTPFYETLLSQEIAGGEPELAMLTSLLPAGGTAVDVGANQGVYAYVLSTIADEVHAFEPHPEFALFCRRMLPQCVHVHAVALSNTLGHARFHIPIGDDGSELYLAGNLKNAHRQFPCQRIIDVEVDKLDSFGFNNVKFVKIDVEGSELDVLEGGTYTIARCKPVLLLELLSGTFLDPLSATSYVCQKYGYKAVVVHEGNMLDAIATIRSLESNSTYDSPYSSRNVLFLPR